MSDIFCPPSLNSADSLLNLAASLQKLLDPVERKKIEADIVAFHALNVAEAKKAADAKALIKQHSDILAETNRVAAQNKKDAADLVQKQADFKAESELEKMKIAEKWSDVKTAADAAKNLHDKAEKMINDVAGREGALKADKEAHAVNVKKLFDDSIALEEKRKGIEKFQQEVMAMDTQTKEKVEKLKQFNF